MKSRVGFSLVVMVLWGHTTPQHLQKVMSLLKSDLKLFEAGRLDTNHIDKLAGLGSDGVYPNNMWTQLKNCCQSQSFPSCI